MQEMNLTSKSDRTGDESHVQTQLFFVSFNQTRWCKRELVETYASTTWKLNIFKSIDSRIYIIAIYFRSPSV